MDKSNRICEKNLLVRPSNSKSLVVGSSGKQSCPLDKPGACQNLQQRRFSPAFSISYDRSSLHIASGLAGTDQFCVPPPEIPPWLQSRDPVGMG